MKKNTISSAIFFVLLLSPSLFYSQSTLDKYQSHTWYDEIVGRNNTNLFNGIIYEEEYPVIGDRHRFFVYKNFMEGTIIYDDESYYKLPLKYDVYGDEVLVKLQNGYGEVVLQLIKSKLNHFVIGNHQFSRIDNKKADEKEIYGFHEILIENSFFTFYKKYKKKKKKSLENKKVTYEFIDKHRYVLLYNKEYYKIKTRNDLIEIFPEFKKNIKIYNKDDQSIQKSNSDTFLISLLKRIHVFMSQINKLEQE